MPSSLRKQEESGAAATVLTAIVDQPYGYGRIVRLRGKISRIVEERDASPVQRKIKEVNGGVYVFSLPPLFDALRGLATANAQGEYYLTDLISTYRRGSWASRRCSSKIRTRFAALTAGLNWQKRVES